MNAAVLQIAVQVQLASVATKHYCAQIIEALTLHFAHICFDMKSAVAFILLMVVFAAGAAAAQGQGLSSALTPIAS